MSLTTEDTEGTERATPETDAQITTFDSISKYKKRFKNKTGRVSAEFARKLERERDEAREALDEAHKYFKWIYLVADSQRKWNFRTLATEGLMKTGGAK